MRINNIIFCFLVLILSYYSNSQTKYETNKLDELLNDLNQNDELNGNILVAKKGEIIFNKSYGLADIENKRKLNTNSIFELASVSKQFTAMGVYLLSKQNKLNLEDKLSKHIPELGFYENIKISNLIYHTS